MLPLASPRGTISCPFVKKKVDISEKENRASRRCIHLRVCMGRTRTSLRSSSIGCSQLLASSWFTVVWETWKGLPRVTHRIVQTNRPVHIILMESMRHLCSALLENMVRCMLGHCFENTICRQIDHFLCFQCMPKRV